MKIVAVIPARYASTRLPAKLLQLIGDKPVIVHTYANIVQSKLFDEVWVVTDHDEIEQTIKANGGNVFRSQKEHESGSDRIAEAIEHMDVDVIVNVQGDEPFMPSEPLRDLVALFRTDVQQQIQVASLMHSLTDAADINNPNQVKVVVDQQHRALYFSRSPIPFNRNQTPDIPYWKHIGVYAFRKKTLLQFTKWPIGILENSEKLEQLRYLENGIAIHMVPTTFATIGIDTIADLEKARAWFTHKNVGNS